MEHLITMWNLVNALEHEPSSNEKIRMLKYANDMFGVDEEILKHLLKATYDPFSKYGISKKALKEYDYGKEPKNIPIADFYHLLYDLEIGNINDNLRRQVQSLFDSIEYEGIAELVRRIIGKDLACGISYTTINKVFPELIPVFDVMKGESIDKHIKKMKGKDVIVTEKLDGVRCICTIHGDSIKFYSRQGKEIDGLEQIKDEIRSLDLKDIVLDGELTIQNDKSMESKEAFKQAMKIISAKADVKIGLRYNVFDILPYNHFVEGVSAISCKRRKEYLAEKLKDTNHTLLNPVEILFSGVYNEPIIDGLHEQIVSAGGEGLMINIANAPYVCKRTSNLLKVKKMKTYDLRIVGFESGEGKFANTLGRLIVDYKGYRVGVGSGFTEEERDEFWNNQDKYRDRVAEIQFFEETQDENGNLSLRFPVFKMLREVGKGVSYD